MGKLEWAWIGVLVLAAASILILLYLQYRDLVAEIERDAGWHRMWHERIWQDEDEPRRDSRRD